MDLNRRELDVSGVPVRAYGQLGRPLLVFPSELGKRWDWEDNGMIGALGEFVDEVRDQHHFGAAPGNMLANWLALRPLPTSNGNEKR